MTRGCRSGLRGSSPASSRTQESPEKSFKQSIASPQHFYAKIKGLWSVCFVDFSPQTCLVWLDEGELQPKVGRLASLRGSRQMDFGALDYSGDRRKVRQRGVVGSGSHSLPL